MIGLFRVPFVVRPLIKNVVKRLEALQRGVGCMFVVAAVVVVVVVGNGRDLEEEANDD